MVQRPNVVGLLVCEKTIVEENTRNITTVNHFTRLRVDSFPSPPQRFTVYSVLTDGLGEVGLVLRVVRLGYARGRLLPVLVHGISRSPGSKFGLSFA
jgi:hypothetical protein